MPRASATRAPATRDQADAYRFGVRRIEAALVRGDPVPLHEQIRTQRRAAGVGVALGVLGVGGCLLFSLFAPAPDWSSRSVVVGAESGALYVVAHQPDRLVPVANLPAARLVLAALRAGRSSTTEPGLATATVVPDAKLDTAPRSAAAAVPGAIAVRPDATIAPRWAVCDTVGPDAKVVTTTVVGGADIGPPAADLDADDAALLRGPDRRIWLVAGGRRHEVDWDDPTVRGSLGFSEQQLRDATAAVVESLPEGARIAVPTIPGRGQRGPGGLSARVGQVLVTHTQGGPDRYLVTLADGVQEIPQGMANVLLAGAQPQETSIAELDATPEVQELPAAAWPARPLHVVAPADARVTCWRWSGDSDMGGVAWIGRSLPLPAGATPVRLAQADASGPELDEVAVGPGGAVRGVVAGRAPGSGPVWLVSSTGVAYGVADPVTAAVLGVTDAQAAPERILRLLPVAPTLDVAQAAEAMDVAPPS